MERLCYHALSEGNKITRVQLLASTFGLCLLFSCNTPKKPQTPALTPELAAQLLHYDQRALDFIARAKKQNPYCEYSVTLPDQVPPMTQIDVKHIVLCQNRPAPLEFDASATFVYDPALGRWQLKRFSS